jgi:mono/diheme cytochrome c family protein
MKLRYAPLLLLALAATALAQTPEDGLPAGQGKGTFEARCSTCHGVGRVLIYKRTKAQWAATVSAMQEKGLMATDAEIDQIVEYLTAALPAPPEPTASPPSGGVGTLHGGSADQADEVARVGR